MIPKYLRHTRWLRSRSLMQSIVDRTRWYTVQSCHPGQEFLLCLSPEKHISGSPECSIYYLSLPDLNQLVVWCQEIYQLHLSMTCLKEFVSVTEFVS